MSYVFKAKRVLKLKTEYRGTPPQFGMTDQMVHFIHHRKRPEKPA